MDLKGKKIAFLGDSITEGVGVENQELRYDRRMAAKYGIEAVNFGISGTRLAHQKAASEKPRFDLCFCGRAYDLPKDSDIIVVFGGTNDYGHGDAPFGAMGDRTVDTFTGACHFLFSELVKKYPDARIVILTPLQTSYNQNPSPHTGKPLIDYVDAIIEIAAHYSLPVLDLYRTAGICPRLEEQRTRFMPDGLHPCDAGAYRVAERLAAFLESL